MIFKLNDTVKIKATGQIGKIVDLIESQLLYDTLRTNEMIVVHILNELSEQYSKEYFTNGELERYVEHIIEDELFEI